MGRPPEGDGETPASSLWVPERRALTVGLVSTVTLVAAEALAVVTVMPQVARGIGGLRLYGWVFSAFLLGSMVGIVAAGRQADRSGPARPYAAGLACFSAGLVVAGLAPSMIVLVAGRTLQGIGAGAIPAVAYVAIGRSFPEGLRARMMAVLSTAWVVPGIVGPLISAGVAHAFGWRWVFLGLLPLVAVAGAFALPGLVRLGPPTTSPEAEHRLVDAVRTASTRRCSASGDVVGGPRRTRPGRAKAPATATRGNRPKKTHRHPKACATPALINGPTMPGTTQAVDSTAIIRARSPSGKLRPMAT